MDSLFVAPPTMGTRKRLSPHGWAVGGITLVVAMLLGALSWTESYTLHTASYDLVIFDQAVRSYSHFQLPVSLVKGMNDGFGQLCQWFLNQILRRGDLYLQECADGRLPSPHVIANLELPLTRWAELQKDSVGLCSHCLKSGINLIP